MFGKKKQKNLFSKKCAGRAGSATIGTHVPRHGAIDPSSVKPGGTVTQSGEAKFAPKPEGTDPKEYPAARRTRSVKGGKIAQVAIPTESTKARKRGKSKRAASRSLAEKQQRRSSRQHWAVWLTIAGVALVVAVAVGLFSYFHISNAKLVLEPSNASEALVAPDQDEPAYTFCAATLGTATSTGGHSTDAYLLVRVDETARQLTVAAIPANLDVWLSDGENHPLYEACALGGDAELVRAVAELAEVDIAHFVYTDASGMASMVDAMGGVTVDIATEVDDPRAGTAVMQAGEMTLNGQEALVLLRAANFGEPFQGAARNRIDFFEAFIDRALSATGVEFAAWVGSLGDYASTDYTAEELMDLADALRPASSLTVYEAIIPGHVSLSTGKYVYSDEGWAAMAEAMRAGDDPTSVHELADDAEATGITVEVRNGSGSTGMAATMGEFLRADGFTVTGEGNSDDGTLYGETLVIHKDEATEGQAKAVQAALGSGRVVEGGDFYSFDADVLVIIGRDWML